MRALPEIPIDGQRLDLEGRRLWLHRLGEAGPTVVFLPGAGLIGADYWPLHEAAGRLAASVIYDRGGTGSSDAIALPRTAASAAHELQALLAAANAPGPYILVGHSLGGAYARRFAQLYPDRTAGLLLLDPAHEGYGALPGPSFADQIAMIPRLVRALAGMKAFYRPMFARMLAAWPTGLRDWLIDYHLRFWRRTLAETANLQRAVLAEVADGGPLPGRPLIVLTAMGIDPFMAAFSPLPYLQALNASKRVFYDDLARSVRHGENRPLADAGHSTLHTDRPDAVIQAIEDLVAAALHTGLSSPD